MKRPPIKDRALALLRRARDEKGWHSEALACDYAMAALVADGVPARTARGHVQRAWRERFEIAGPV